MSDNSSPLDRLSLAPEPSLTDYSGIAFDLREAIENDVQAAIEETSWVGDDGMWRDLQMEVLASDMSLSRAVNRFTEHALPMSMDAVRRLTPVERELLWVNYRIPESLADLDAFTAAERLAEFVCCDVLEKLWLESSYGSDR